MKNIGFIIIILISVILFLVGGYFVIKDTQEFYENCHYELKDNITCKVMSGAYETKFGQCSDGFIHTGEPYKEVCNEGYKK